MNLFNRQKCSRCGSEITRNAPVSPTEGLAVGQKFAKGQATHSDVENFYRSIGNNCPSCFDNHGKKCPGCGAAIKFFS